MRVRVSGFSGARAFTLLPAGSVSQAVDRPVVARNGLCRPVPVGGHSSHHQVGDAIGRIALEHLRQVRFGLFPSAQVDQRDGERQSVVLLSPRNPEPRGTVRQRQACGPRAAILGPSESIGPLSSVGPRGRRGRRSPSERTRPTEQSPRPSRAGAGWRRSMKPNPKPAMPERESSAALRSHYQDTRTSTGRVPRTSFSISDSSVPCIGRWARSL